MEIHTVEKEGVAVRHSYRVEEYVVLPSFYYFSFLIICCLTFKVDGGRVYVGVYTCFRE